MWTVMQGGAFSAPLACNPGELSSSVGGCGLRRAREMTGAISSAAGLFVLPVRHLPGSLFLRVAL
jgi:hypothetical protein